MRGSREFPYGKAVKAGLMVIVLVLGTVFRGPLLRAAAGLAYTAATMQLPVVSVTQSAQQTASQAVSAESEVLEVVEPVSAVSEAPQSQATAATGSPIKEILLGVKDGDTSIDGVTLSNKTSLKVDIPAALSKDPVMDLVRNGRPQVLIIHTHGSEAYLAEEQQSYDDKQKWNSTDPDRGVIAVGDAIARILNDAGINTVHDTELYDTPQFTGAYERAGEAIEDWLKKYSSIEMVIDVHRDSITYSDGTKIKPTVEIDGQKAAQVMMIVGCDGTGALPFSGWKNNLSLAFRLQRQLNASYEGLARPIYFIDRRYNMHYTKNSLLIEVGTEVNTLDEALYSAELVGQALLEVLEES